MDRIANNDSIGVATSWNTKIPEADRDGNGSGAIILSQTARDGVARAQRCCESGDLLGAIDSLKYVVAGGCRSGDVVLSLCHLLYQAESFEELLITSSQVLRHDPHSIEARFFRIESLIRLRLWLDMAEDLDRFLALPVVDVGKAVKIASSLEGAERILEASRVLELAIGKAPESRELLAARGGYRVRQRMYEAAKEDLQKALSMCPADVEIINNLAVAHQQLGRPQQAERLLRPVIEIGTNSPHVWFNFGNVLRELGQRQAAIEAFDQAIGLSSTFVSAIYNKGLTHYEDLQLDRAIECYEQVLRLEPDHSHASWNLAIARLLLGHWESGWRSYESRLEGSIGGQVVGPPGVPRWTGHEPLKGKSILVIGEQGFGDAIQFSRYVRYLGERGAEAIMYGRPQLTELLRGVAGVTDFISGNAPPPSTDFFIPLMSLPAALGLYRPEDAGEQQYLTADPALVRRRRQSLKRARKPRLGVAWRGSATNANDKTRSIDLKLFLTGLTDDFEVFSLQHDVREDEKTRASKNHIRLSGACSFAEAAALVSVMDLVVTVDTVFAHLAGALNKNVWILLPYVPDWRWGVSGDTSPWYPSATLYRQQADRSWSSVLSRVKNDLRLWQQKHAIAHD